ncbi:hypothetical protein BDZ94DRAFT_1306763 [Collybia nuda]|uniref:Fungal calcium binding protein domain-containing protein n=1 Tax=Collybia nuda TaxID=64659 RepID=A0A9P5YDI7_9AGAR|nr:hypothetical protein BDZ94DRAFT_1306763 [Collybia nuda]
MQFTYIFAVLFMIASTVLAVPTGRISMRASCDIGGCVSALAPTVSSCANAIGSKGKDLVSAGISCLSDAANTVTNFPADCNQCLKQFDIVGKAKAAGTAIKNAAEGAADEVEDVAEKAGDAIKKIF